VAPRPRVVPDDDIVKLLCAAATVLGVTMEDAMEALGYFWSTTYALAPGTGEVRVDQYRVAASIGH